MERKPNLSLKECKMAILEERRVDYIASTSGDPDQTQHADQNGDHDAPQNGEQNGHHYSSSNPGSDPTLGSSNAFYGLDNETQTPPNPNPNLSQPENLSQSSSSTATIHSSVLPPLQNQHPPPSRSSSPSLTLNRPSSQIVSNETSQVQTSTTAYNSHSVILLDLTHILSLYTAVQQGLDPIQGLNQGLDEGEVQQQVPFTAFKLHPEDLECVPESMLPYSNNTSSPSNPLWDTVDDNHPPHIFPRNSNSDIGRTRSHNQSNELQRNNYMNDSLVSDVSYPANTDSFGVENPLWNNSSSQNQYSQRDFRNQNRACINTVSTSNTSQYQIPTISTPIFNVYSQPFTLTLQPTDDTVNFHLTYLGSVPFPKMDITLTLSNQPPTLDSYEFDNKFNKARSAFNHITIEELRVLIESENFSKSEKQILRIELSLQPHPPKPKYAGLKNQGATCYISSLIQMLYHLKFFRKQVRKLEEEKRLSERDHNSIKCSSLHFSFFTPHSSFFIRSSTTHV
ncbi:hypothetical protein TL16_g07893 [Triparma laevis f. inornata]|uniref:USP domain-containing protein n=1 Tax=Triparma laevis f. inornata TaxID=1714386 RepID=A0A9W7B050_9STRA|nr:hypothetical protein TL16_g07893 [Triparma laevis f. inornata]